MNRKRRNTSLDCTVASMLLTTTLAFHIQPYSFVQQQQQRTRLSLFAPPGSGYKTPEDEPLKLPETYEPMMEYPGTMRPGRTPENMPFHDLPIADSDPDPVPWPHFQQIEWHHRWDPPHPHPIPMEVFIEMEGRWASAEDEAAMRAGARRDVRERRELAEDDRKSTLIVDDDDDEEEEEDLEINMELGEGMFGALGSGSEEAMTAKAVTEPQPAAGNKQEETDEEEDDDFDDFLLDLGLEGGSDDLLLDDSKDSTANLLDAMSSMLGGDDEEESDGELTDDDLDFGLLDTEEGTIDIKMDTDDEMEDPNDVAALSDDEDLDIGLDEDDEDLSADGGMTMVPLEDFGDDSLLDDDDAFDDGGFDYDGDDGGDFDGGDGW